MTSSGVVLSLAGLSRPPKAAECQNAWRVLQYAYGTARSFLGAFTARQVSKGKGAPSGADHDLLRAALVFTSAGLDSMVKHLVQDALPSVIKRNDGARERLQSFIEDQLEGDERPDYKLLAKFLVAESPIDGMASELVRALRANSLQSAEELFRAASYFDIEPEIICNNIRYLRQIFRARNEIIHELDIDFSRPNRNRRSRPRDSMIAQINELFDVEKSFLAAVDAKLA